MKLELFAICEGAYNHNGQLTIVNTLDCIEAPEFPCRVSFGVAIKLGLQGVGAGHSEMTISMVNSSGEKVFDPVFSTPLEIAENNPADCMAMAVNFQNVLFTKAGDYHVRLEINGDKIGEHTLRVKNNV